MNIADTIWVLGHLFLGKSTVLPCGDGSTIDTGNVSLYDWNGDAAIDIADGIGALVHMFTGGPAHVLGPISECVVIEGCPEVCRPGPDSTLPDNLRTGDPARPEATCPSRASFSSGWRLMSGSRRNIFCGF